MKKESRQWNFFAFASAATLLVLSTAASGQDNSSGVNSKGSSPTQSASQAMTNTSDAQKRQSSARGPDETAGKSAIGDTSGSGNSDTAASAAGKGEADKQSKSQSAKNNSAALPPGHPTVGYVMVPIAAPENKEWMKKGCWAKFHDDQNFSGDTLTLMGPVDMPEMRGPFGIDWKGKISSVETGAKARVLVYDNENYNDLVATFKPGQKTKDVSKKMGFFDEFSSLKITCAGA